MATDSRTAKAEFSAIHALGLADNRHLQGSNKQDLIMVGFLCSVETCYGIRKETLTDMQEAANTNCVSGSEAMWETGDGGGREESQLLPHLGGICSGERKGTGVFPPVLCQTFL